MKTLVKIVLGVLLVGVCFTGVGMGQDVASPGAATTGAGNEAKNFVQGRVTLEPGGQGIRKVRVVLWGSPKSQEATTDDKGQFRIEGVDPGAYVVELLRSGYVAETKTRRERTISLSAGQNLQDLQFHMRTAGVITGKIVDTDGDPLRDVGVVVTASSGAASPVNRGRQGAASTNDLGEYRIADLEPGSYIVQASPQNNEPPLQIAGGKEHAKEAMAYVTTYFPGSSDKRQATPVEVLAGATVTANFGVRTSHAYRVSGSIGLVGEHGLGELILIRKDGQREQATLTEGGKFEFPRLLEGTYRAELILASAYVIGEQPSSKIQRISTPIEVNGADVVGLQLQIDTGGDVSGKFRSEGQEKVNWSELSVTLLPVPEGEEDTSGSGLLLMQGGLSQVNEEGSFEMKDLPGVNTQLVVVARSETFRDYYTKSVLLGGREVVDTGFSVSPGTVLDVVVSAKGAGIDGRVVDGDGKPVAGAVVVTVPSSGKLGRPDAYQVTGADQNGHFVLRGLNPGEFSVLALEDMRENNRSPEFAKKYEGKGEKVKLEEGEKKSVVVKLIGDEGGKKP